MNTRSTRLKRLLRLVRRAAAPRPPVPALDAAERRWRAQHALAAAQRLRPDTAIPQARNWASTLERLSWWAAGAAATVCLILAARPHLAAEPDGLQMLLEWPASRDTRTFDFFQP